MTSPYVLGSMALIAAIASLLTSMFIVYTERWHRAFSLDKDLGGAQKFHTNPVPRVGGIALLTGLVAVLISDTYFEAERSVTVVSELGLLMLAAMPVFLAGLIEDLTKRISVRVRFCASFASALAAGSMLGAFLPRLDTWGVDELLQLTPIAVVLTLIAVTGVTNSVNIIDGFNGLAASVAIIILTSLGLLAYQAGDVLLLKLAIIGIGTTVGFFIVNYPTGRMFMGDGGAYLIGFWIAEIAVLTIVRNPTINAWQVLAICAYPVIEVLYSIYRKTVLRNTGPGNPDRLHLHMLVYRRLVCQWVPRRHTQYPPWRSNALVACIIAPVVCLTSLLAIQFGDSVVGGVVVVLFESILYLALYARLVRGHWCLHPMVGLGLRHENRSKAT